MATQDGVALHTAITHFGSVAQAQPASKAKTATFFCGKLAITTNTTLARDPYHIIYSILNLLRC
ncbi:MAG: hypothetical protein QXW91_04415 [Candidatus Nitrosotenuis sp.]